MLCIHPTQAGGVTQILTHWYGSDAGVQRSWLVADLKSCATGQGESGNGCQPSTGVHEIQPCSNQLHRRSL